MKKVAINFRNIKNCICGKCPSFPGKIVEMMKLSMPGLYCGKGKSPGKIDKKGCICKDCLVQKEHELTGMYYCIEGKIEEKAK